MDLIVCKVVFSNTANSQHVFYYIAQEKDLKEKTYTSYHSQIN